MELLQSCHCAGLIFPISGIVNFSISMFIECFAHKDHLFHFAHFIYRYTGIYQVPDRYRYVPLRTKTMQYPYFY